MRTVLDLTGQRTRAGDEVPRIARRVVFEVDLLLTLVPAEYDLLAVEGPRPELHFAVLLIERKVFDVYRA